MEKKSPRPMTPFDEWTVPNELHTLKLLLPYTPAASQPALGMLIKVIELQHTMEYFHHKKNFIHSQDFSNGFSSPLDILEEISPYLPPEEAGMIDTFRNMMNIMDMVQMMQAFSDSNGDASAQPDSSGNGAPSAESNNSGNENTFAKSNRPNSKNSSAMPGGLGSGFNPMSLIMGMLSPEQQEMFEMYQTMFSQPEESEAASTEFSEDDTLNAQDNDFSGHNGFEAQDNTFSNDNSFEVQDNNFSDNNAFETQRNDFSEDYTFESQRNDFSMDYSFETQNNDFSEDYTFESQNNNKYSNKERNGIDYE